LFSAGGIDALLRGAQVSLAAGCICASVDGSKWGGCPQRIIKVEIQVGRVARRYCLSRAQAGCVETFGVRALGVAVADRFRASVQ